MSTSILLVDDPELLGLGFRMVLDAQPEFTVVGEPANGDEALARR